MTRLIDADRFIKENAEIIDCEINHPKYQETLRELIDEAPTVDRPHGECKTCKHYVPYRDQFSYGYRGDGYCKSTVTTSEGQAYINCHDEWYCANYEKAGDEK